MGLVLPVGLCGVALFVASFLSWMVLQLHKDDWIKLKSEDEFIGKLRELEIPVGSYMFPAAETRAEMNSEDYARKWQSGPSGVVTVFGPVSMGRNLALTFIYFLVISGAIAWLTSRACPPGESFILVFKFSGTVALLAYLSAIVQHSIWFHVRILGHIIESVLYAVMTGVILGAMWPAV